jgi:nucleoside-diphosphate-sugar epimerase
MVKKILITGGCGFVGRHLVKRLSQDLENQITIVDDLSTGLPIEKWPEHLKCEIHEVIYGDCVQFFNERFEKFDDVFHLAAIVESRTTIENDPLKVAKDLTIDSQLFNWAVKTRPGKIIYFSSSAVYPIKYQTKQFNIPLQEDVVSFKQNRIDMPDMSYGWSKLTGEYLSYLAAEKYRLRVAIYRPFSGYGEDQALTYPFPAIMNRIVNKEIPIEVWGDGMQSRDFVYIEDCIDCILSTYEKIDNAEALNIGSGKKTTFLELIKLSCEINEVEFSIKPLLNKPVGVFARYCDMKKQKSFGFYPRHSLEDGIKIVCEYQRNKKLQGKS